MVEKVVNWFICIYCTIASYGAFKAGNVADFATILAFAVVIACIDSLEEEEISV